MVPTSSLELSRPGEETVSSTAGAVKMPGPDRAVVTLEAGQLAADLLTLRSSDESGERIIAALLEVTQATWAGLYRPGGKSYRAVQDAALRAGTLPERFENTAVRAVLEKGGDLRAASSRELRSLPGLTLVASFRSEFDGDPVLVVIGPRSLGEYQAEDLERISEILSVCGAAWRNIELVERLQSQVFVDFLTGCYNRRAFDEHLTIELVRARRYERPLSLMLVDLDDFKDVNDGSGHDAGDHVLQLVGEALRTAFRTTDRVCRFGGDEFAVIFPETSKEEALRLAERLRRQIGSIFPDSRTTVPITASIGVASYPLDGARAEDLLKASDRALYQAKGAGRNRVAPA